MFSLKWRLGRLIPLFAMPVYLIRFLKPKLLGKQDQRIQTNRNLVNQCVLLPIYLTIDIIQPQTFAPLNCNMYIEELFLIFSSVVQLSATVQY